AAGLAGFGIWLGRFVRLNSWDVVARPGPLLDALAAPLVDPLGSARAWAVTLLFGAFLFVVHAGLRAGREARPAR
ncbi:MAG TPA: DUF1361 domain-containing protein, partial [Polyangiaceae bacterium LLY-WYZ-15_(1-7)]|nr:DUF1361 domain-containing protein [Polyangiaceae bacterium LLY-WYZ-15_(1-7)]